MLKISHARKFAEHVAPHVIRPARIMWNQIIGAIFAVIAISAFWKAWQIYRTLDADSQNMVPLCIAAAFGLLMAFFGLTSLLRARNLSRL